MNIKELAKKYDLVEGDFWNHKQSGQWILTHDAVEKVATKEGIRLVNIETLNSETDLVRFLVTMVKDEVTITSVGEADRNNCFSQYLGCMAEKRGVDRCVLKLINAYEYGISSEVEAEDFKRPETDQQDQGITKAHAEKVVAAQNPPETADGIVCPKCKGGMTDNRDIDGGAKLSGKGQKMMDEKKPLDGPGLKMPLYKCSDDSCKGVIWEDNSPKDDGESKRQADLELAEEELPF